MFVYLFVILYRHFKNVISYFAFNLYFESTTFNLIQN